MTRTRAVSVDHGDARTEDSFETKLEFAFAAMKYLQELHNLGEGEGLRVLEPSAGTGNWVRAARALLPKAVINAVEIRGDCLPALYKAGANVVLTKDFLSIEPADIHQPYDLVIGNPPFGGKDPVPPHLDPCNHIRHALKFLRSNSHLNFLLKLAFLCTEKRWKGRPEGHKFGKLEPFWPRHPLERLTPLAPRLSFLVPSAILDGWAQEAQTKELALRDEGKVEEADKVKPRKPSNDTAEYGLFEWRTPGAAGDLYGKATVSHTGDGTQLLEETLFWTDLIKDHVASHFEELAAKDLTVS